MCMNSYNYLQLQLFFLFKTFSFGHLWFTNSIRISQEYYVQF